MDLSILAISLLLAAPPSAAPAVKAADPWSALRFLLGTWKAETGGGFTFAIDVGGKVMVRRNRSELAPGPGEAKGTVHEDLMVLYPKGRGLQALCWDDEGRVIRYAVRSEAGTVIFESEPGAPGPRYRLVYARRGADDVEVSFAKAPTGKDFQPAVTGRARRSAGP